jgi:hypothetical protein
MATKIFKILTGHYKSSTDLNKNKSASTNNLNNQISKQETSTSANKNSTSSDHPSSRLKPIRDFFKQKFTNHYKSTSELNKKPINNNNNNKESSQVPINITKPNLREKLIASKNSQPLTHLNISQQTLSEDEGLSKTPQYLTENQIIKPYNVSTMN